MKDGLIVGVGKAGNPDIMDGVTEGMIVGSNTEVSPNTLFGVEAENRSLRERSSS